MKLFAEHRSSFGQMSFFMLLIKLLFSRRSVVFVLLNGESLPGSLHGHADWESNPWFLDHKCIHPFVSPCQGINSFKFFCHCTVCLELSSCIHSHYLSIINLEMPTKIPSFSDCFCHLVIMCQHLIFVFRCLVLCKFIYACMCVCKLNPKLKCNIVTPPSHYWPTHALWD